MLDSVGSSSVMYPDVAVCFAYCAPFILTFTQKSQLFCWFFATDTTWAGPPHVTVSGRRPATSSVTWCSWRWSRRNSVTRTSGRSSDWHFSQRESSHWQVSTCADKPKITTNIEGSVIVELNEQQTYGLFTLSDTGTDNTDTDKLCAEPNGNLHRSLSLSSMNISRQFYASHFYWSLSRYVAVKTHQEF